MDANADRPPQGRLLALDLGEKRVGVAVSDELRLTSRPLPPLSRSNWKDLLGQISKLCAEFDVKGVVVGLPLLRDGAEGEAATRARQVARNLSLSLRLPVFLQDEHLTSVSAELTMRGAGAAREEILRRIDGEAASLILSDFLQRPRHDEP